MNPRALHISLAASVLLLAACSKKSLGTQATAGTSGSGLVAPEEQSPHYPAVASHLELGGTLYGYADIDGDVLTLADTLQSLTHQLVSDQPALGAVQKQDFRKLFADLGFTDVKAIGFSSVRETSGMYRNRAFLYTPEGRHGLLAVLGVSPHRFANARMAPDDTDYYMENEVNLRALYTTLQTVVSRLMGPKAAEAFEASLKAPSSGFSILELVRNLRGRVTLFIRFDPTATYELRTSSRPIKIPAFSAVIAVDGIGSVLEPGLANSPALQASKDGALRVFAVRDSLPVRDITPALVVSGKTFYATTSVEFLKECLARKQGLDANPEFASGLAALGPEGNGISYLSQRFFSKLRGLGTLNPDATPEQKHIFDALALNVPIVSRSLMSVRTNLDDGVLMRSEWNQSLKPDLAMLTVFNPITAGLLFTGAIPAYQSVQRASEAKQVIGHLHDLFEAQQGYFQANPGVETASYTDLVGPGKAIPTLALLPGEDYMSLVFRRDEPVTVRLPSGAIFSYPTGAPAPAIVTRRAAEITPAPSRAQGERDKLAQQIGVLNNLYTLDEAAKKFYLQNGVSQAAYTDLVGPGKLVERITPVIGEDYTGLVFTKDQKVELRLPDGRIIRYPLGNLAPKSTSVERPQNIQPQSDPQLLAIAENLRILDEAANKYYTENDTTTTTFDRLVGPGKALPSISPAMGEDYRPLLFKKDHPLHLYLKDGRSVTYPPQQPTN